MPLSPNSRESSQSVDDGSCARLLVVCPPYQGLSTSPRSARIGYFNINLIMFNCTKCNAEFRDGALCSVCQGHFDFACAGVTETGYRRLGDRKSSFKCAACKNLRSASPLPTPSTSPLPADMDAVLTELKRLSLQVSVLPGLDASIQTMRAEIAELRTIIPELSDIKTSIDFVDRKVEDLSDRITKMEKDIQSLQNTKVEMEHLQSRVHNLEAQLKENEQRSRLNNIEIKGVPVTKSENLFDIIAKIGTHVKCTIPKEQINYIARVPMRNDKLNKTIVVAVHSRYIKDDFVAAAKKCTTTAADLGFQDSTRVFINDHLTLDNKVLLNKTKNLSRERGFAFTWVKGCKIFVRKNPTSPVIAIRAESDLKKL